MNRNLNTACRLSILIFCALCCFSGKTTGLDSVINIDVSAHVATSTVSKTLPVQPDRINARIARLYADNNKDALISIADSLRLSLSHSRPDSSSLSEICYSIGVSMLLADRYSESLRWLEQCVKIKEDAGLIDDHYANAVYNTGVAYNYLGDFSKVTECMLAYIDLGMEMYGEHSPEVAGAYSTLVGTSLEKNDYEGFSEYTQKTLEILANDKNALYGSELSRFYINVGTGYAWMSDHTKARIYFEEAESIYNSENLERDHNYINLINSLAIVYGNLGMSQKQKEYYERGMGLAVSSNSFLAFNLITSFATELGRAGIEERGEDMLSDLVERSEEVYGPDSRFYISALYNYADYLTVYRKDFRKSMELYSGCIDYLHRHDEEVVLREPVMSGYALSLLRDSQSEKALETIQELLFFRQGPASEYGKYENPALSELRTDRQMLKLLKLKYDILKQIYSDSGDQQVLENAALTSELIISLIDRVRMNISEDESRIILGDKYRDSYLQAINDFESCFRLTGEERFLDKTFEFAEKSKAAGLLAATRELNAINFHIPPELADLEKSLQREIAFLNSRISKENEKEIPDRDLITRWNKSLLEAVKIKDSLLLTYETDYPAYFALKYSFDALSVKELPQIAGNNVNYLNYIVSDSILYIIIVNRKHKHVHKVTIDSSFTDHLQEFRNLLSDADMSVNAREKYESFSRIGYYLYSVLIEPVRKYFISDELLISPDNILSYLPFETFLSAPVSGEEIIYRTLPYLMNNFSISYTYSASFMKETSGRKYGNSRRLVAFAPLYTRPVHIDSLSMKRNTGTKILYDLPHARSEAMYISEISGGTLYINDQAAESVFKAEAGNYDIIHLAMHTWLSDQNPMASAMIFSQINDQPEDGFLNTFEVYGIPLKARMVVLSSCNTGSGILSTGEGILSLARGFIYSGSQSVVMSLWEIEDKSGTEIVTMFYDELMKGFSKSRALKKARTEYLKHASQMKSHPYFWSALTVYGDNSGVYPRREIVILAICALVLALSAAYFLYRRYS